LTLEEYDRVRIIKVQFVLMGSRGCVFMGTDSLCI